MRLSELLPAFLIALASCSVESSKDSSSYPEWEFAQKSNKLLMKDWLAKGYIYENWNAVTGQGDDVGNSDRFYHWGSLLGYINLIEN